MKALLPLRRDIELTVRIRILWRRHHRLRKRYSILSFRGRRGDLGMTIELGAIFFRSLFSLWGGLRGLRPCHD
jgi:hypothetical protein